MTSLASLREMRTALAVMGYPTEALNEEIALLSAVDDPFLSPSEVAEVRALLAKGYTHPMVSERVASSSESAALLAVDLVGAGAHETRVIEVCSVCDAPVDEHTFDQRGECWGAGLRLMPVDRDPNEGDPHAHIDWLNDQRERDQREQDSREEDEEAERLQAHDESRAGWSESRGDES